jgi:hypothetical protein
MMVSVVAHYVRWRQTEDDSRDRRHAPFVLRESGKQIRVFRCIRLHAIDRRRRVRGVDVRLRPENAGVIVDGERVLDKRELERYTLLREGRHGVDKRVWE